MVIHIYGASGSGTSSLGKKLASKLNYQFMDTDDYFWLDTDPKYTNKRDVNERLDMMNKDIDNYQNVVISGSLNGWGNPLIKRFDLVIRLVVDSNIRIERLKQREYERFGNRIKEGGDMYETHLSFIKWAKQYDDGPINMRSKLSHDDWHNKLNCKKMILDGSKDLDELVKEILKELNYE